MNKNRKIKKEENSTSLKVILLLTALTNLITAIITLVKALI
ncbi:hypothetical protein [Eubacterium ventriosum]